MPPANRDANEPYHLQRFLDAQASCFAQVQSELAAGRKQTHWMWFVFPQLAGLGSSPMARRYAISGPDEAQAYLSHPVLGVRLRECTALVNTVTERSIEEIFGYPDNLKFHSSITLFDQVSSRQERRESSGGNQVFFEAQVFPEALKKYFHGQPDQATIDRLQA